MVRWLRTPLSRAEVAGYLVFVVGFGLLVAMGVWHDPWVKSGSILMAIGTGIAGRGQAVRHERDPKVIA
jgi:protein-S-isoprenylcysteine O-methyltransferase Ste14